MFPWYYEAALASYIGPFRWLWWWLRRLTLLWVIAAAGAGSRQDVVMWGAMESRKGEARAMASSFIWLVFVGLGPYLGGVLFVT
jgi:hypothetical protein